MLHLHGRKLTLIQSVVINTLNVVADNDLVSLAVVVCASVLGRLTLSDKFVCVAS